MSSIIEKFSRRKSKTLNSLGETSPDSSPNSYFTFRKGRGKTVGESDKPDSNQKTKQSEKLEKLEHSSSSPYNSSSEFNIPNSTNSKSESSSPTSKTSKLRNHPNSLSSIDRNRSRSFGNFTYNGLWKPGNLYGINKTSEFRDFLLNEENYKSFQKFLENEFSVENLLFWKDVENYKGCFLSNDLELDKVEGLAKHIYDCYFKCGAKIELNLSGPTKDRVAKLIEKKEINATLFDIPQKQVLELMQSDSFIRYRQQIEKNVENKS